MTSVASTLWRLVLAGAIVVLVAYLKVDIATAKQVGEITGAGMVAAILASAWNF